MTKAFMLALLGHFALVVALYAWLTIARLRAVRSGDARMKDFAPVGGDPKPAARIQRNLANQFEAPLFVYFAAMYLIVIDGIVLWDVAAAWIFLLGRLFHTAVQTLTDNVRLRGQVFVINFAGIVMLMAHVAWHVVMELAR
jgi:hypothetical protein